MRKIFKVSKTNKNIIAYTCLLIVQFIIFLFLILSARICKYLYKNMDFPFVLIVMFYIIDVIILFVVIIFLEKHKKILLKKIKE